MLNSFLVGLIIVAAIPCGFFAAAQVCFAMGFASMPGFIVARSGRERASVVTQFIGCILSWLGQSYVILTFTAILIIGVRLFFESFLVAGILQHVVWIEVFLLSMGPPFQSLTAARNEQQAELSFNLLTLPFTCITTFLGYFGFVFFPRAISFPWAWLPGSSHLYAA